MKFSIKNMLLSGIIFLIGCKKEQPVINEVAADPCDCFELRGEFTVGEFFHGLDSLVASDSIQEYPNWSGTTPSTPTAYVTMEAFNKSAISYEWIIGSDPNHRFGQNVQITFQNVNATIPVTLIVRDSVNTFCDPNDDGIDTITKSIRVEYFEPPILHGTYRGYNSDDPDVIFDLVIDTFRVNTGSSFQIVEGISNLPNGYNSFAGLGMYQTYTFTGVDNLNGVVNTHAAPGISWGILDQETNVLKISYLHQKIVNSTVIYSKQRVFIGKKI